MVLGMVMPSRSSLLGTILDVRLRLSAGYNPDYGLEQCFNQMEFNHFSSKKKLAENGGVEMQQWTALVSSTLKPDRDNINRPSSLRIFGPLPVPLFVFNFVFDTSGGKMSCSWF